MSPTQLFPQESVILAFKRLSPFEWFAGFRFPLVEDLVNDFPFISYPTWRAQRGLDWGGDLWDRWEGPSIPDSCNLGCNAMLKANRQVR